MIASSTEKKQKINKDLAVDLLDELTSKTARYINNWTVRELLRLSQSSKKPICLPRSESGYIIGKFEVWPSNGAWHCQNIFNQQTILFNQKQSAVFYSLCASAGYVVLANQICDLETDASKLRNDLEFYNHGLRTSLIKSDQFREILYKSRIMDARFKLNLVTKQLQKTIRHAKYLKVWSVD
jgi:hypothetical protein